MAIEVTTKRWGNSIGVVIPAEMTEKLNLKPEEKVIIDISKKSNVLKDLFGTLKIKKSTEKMLKDARADIESKWLM